MKFSFVTTASVLATFLFSTEASSLRSVFSKTMVDETNPKAPAEATRSSYYALFEFVGTHFIGHDADLTDFKDIFDESFSVRDENDIHLNDIVHVSSAGEGKKTWSLYLSLDGPSSSDVLVNDVSDMICSMFGSSGHDHFIDASDCSFHLLTADQFLSEIIDTDNEEDDILLFSSVSPYMRSAKSITESGRRHGYVKFVVGGFHGSKWSSRDITDFDTAVHESFDHIHGKTDGMYFAGENIYKITEDDDVKELSLASKNLGKKSKYYNVWASLDYTCWYCPDDDAGMEVEELSSFIVGKDKELNHNKDKDPALNPKALITLSNEICKVITKMGNSDLAYIDYCSAEPTDPEHVAHLVFDEGTKENTGVASSAMTL